MCALLSDFPLGNLGAARETGYLIRAAVLRDAKEFDLSVRGKFKIVALPANQIISEKKYLNESRVSAFQKGIKIGRDEFSAGRVQIIPQKDSSLYVNARRLRGSIEIIKVGNTLTAVNTLDVESYVKGVLYHEASHHWPLAALEAQAVAARSYALYQMEVNKDKDFDVTSDIYSQVYGGRSSERFRTNKAVDETKHLILTYKGRLFPAYYHATCAGRTEDVRELWKQDWLPLRGIRCEYCRISPHYYWKKNFRLKDIQDKLNQNGYGLGLIKEINVDERSASGRVKTLTVRARDGKEIKVSGKDFRNIIGPNVLKSSNFVVDMKGYYVDLIGKGWGHGVGLCQWGAYGMARRGFNFEQILEFYYPGTEIANYETAGF